MYANLISQAAQTGLSHAEVLRRQSLQNGRAKVEQDLANGLLRTEEADDLFGKIEMQESPLRERETRATELGQQANEAAMADQNRQMSEAANFHATASARNVPNQIVELPDPDTGLTHRFFQNGKGELMPMFGGQQPASQQGAAYSPGEAQPPSTGPTNPNWSFDPSQMAGPGQVNTSQGPGTPQYFPVAGGLPLGQTQSQMRPSDFQQAYTAAETRLRGRHLNWDGPVREVRNATTGVVTQRGLLAMSQEERDRLLREDMNSYTELQNEFIRPPQSTQQREPTALDIRQQQLDNQYREMQIRQAELAIRRQTQQLEAANPDRRRTDAEIGRATGYNPAAWLGPQRDERETSEWRTAPNDPNLPEHIRGRHFQVINDGFGNIRHVYPGDPGYVDPGQQAAGVVQDVQEGMSDLAGQATGAGPNFAGLMPELQRQEIPERARSLASAIGAGAGGPTSRAAQSGSRLPQDAPEMPTLARIQEYVSGVDLPQGIRFNPITQLGVTQLPQLATTPRSEHPRVIGNWLNTQGLSIPAATDSNGQGYRMNQPRLQQLQQQAIAAGRTTTAAAYGLMAQLLRRHGTVAAVLASPQARLFQAAQARIEQLATQARSIYDTQPTQPSGDRAPIQQAPQTPPPPQWLRNLPAGPRGGP